MRVLGFHSSNFDTFSIERTAQILTELGFGAIELNMEQAPDFSAHILPDATPDRRAEIRQSIADAGLTLSSLNAHQGMLHRHPAHRQAAEDFVTGAIDLAVDLNTDIVHVVSGFIPDGASEADCWPYFVPTLQRLVHYAAERGIRLAIEAAMFPGFLIHNHQTLQRLLNDVGEQLYVNFDPSQFLPAGDEPVATFRALRPRIIHMHAKDATGTRDNFTFPPLGQGHVNWPALVQAMIDTDYNGPVSVEYEAHFFAKGFPKDPLGSARQSKTFLDKTFAPWLAN